MINEDIVTELLPGGITLCSSRKLGEKYYSARHKSGIRVLVCPKEMSSYYAVIGTGFGSLVSGVRINGEKKTVKLPAGTAHFLEHKMFANPDGSDASEAFASLGADVNAYTSYDKTAYLFNCTENFYECLWQLLYMVTHPYFTNESVQNESAIISEEIRMNADDPYEQCYNRMLRCMYRSGNIRKDICGSQRSVSKITPELLYFCHKCFYQPSELILSVSGKVDIREVLRTLDSALDGHRPENITAQGISSTKKGGNSIRGYAEMQVSKPIFSIGIRNDRSVRTQYKRLYRDTLLSLISESLFTRAGEFFGGMFESGLISPGFSYGSTVLRDAEFTAFSGESRNPEKVLSEYEKFISSVKAKGIDEADFERARRVLYADFITSLDSTDDISTIMLSAALDGVGMFDYLTMINKITLEELNKTLNDEFVGENTFMSVIRPIE